MTKKFDKSIIVLKAALHNLKNIDVEIPRNKFTVITGVSGSGKSSLAFDTIYAEGQRRFVESLSSYARQFLERMQKPDAESITGLPPAVAIEQNTPKKNPRSTVGTSTEIYDYIRLFYGRIGKTYCRETGDLIEKDSPATIVEKVLSYDEKDKIYILFPFPEDAVSIKEEIKKFREFGYFRIVPKNSNEIINLDSDELPQSQNCENTYILADRLSIKKDADSITRLTESIETAFKFGMERVLIRNLTQNKDEKFSGAFEDPVSGIRYLEPEPKLFSFNNPYGACPHCQGFGRTVGIDESLVIPDKSLSIKKEAIFAFRGDKLSKHRLALEKIAPKHNIDINAPYSELSEESLKVIWDGAKGYEGINGFFKILEENSYKMHYRIMLNKYRGYTTCKACGGSRLRTSARQVFVNGKNIPELIEMPLEKLLDFFKKIELKEYEKEIISHVLDEIIRRLELLVDIGLEYLTLNRLNHTLSGGESQRINLSTALGSSLTGTLYVLDEPSIGMHPRDTQRLLNILFKLRDLGNTIVVVEHDPDIIKKADYVIDMGPLAGELGGEVVFSGQVPSLLKSKKSLTGLYMSGKKKD
jgi:excinuclease ABC subunit A